MINQVYLIGRLGKEPETRNAGDAVVTSFSVATTTNWKDKSGNWQEETEWHNINAWRQLGERCAKLSKGALVYVEGRLKTDKYEKDGQTHYSTKIIADNVRKLEPSATASDRPPSGGDTNTGVNGHGKSTTDSDLPF